MADKFSKQQIEIIGIHAVEELLVGTNFESNFNRNDKTPSWDGNIIAYNGTSREKSNILGSIAVQVKGTYKNDLTEDKIKYRVKVSDLKNYLLSNGAVYFVVYFNQSVNNKTGEIKNNKEVYYATLLPYDINCILKKYGNQKSKNIEFKKINKNNPDEVIKIFNSFLENQKRQLIINDEQIEQYENGMLDLSNKDSELKFSIIPNDITKADPNEVLNNDTYIYLHNNKFDIDMVVGKAKLKQYYTGNTNKIKYNGETLYFTVQHVVDSNGCRYIFNNCIIFDKTLHKIHIKLASNLSARIKNYKLFFALLNGTMSIVEKENKKVIDECKKQLKFLEEIEKLLKTLKVKKDLNLNEITDVEIGELTNLIDAIVYNKETPACFENDFEVHTFKISNINICVIYKKVNQINNDKYFDIISPFSYNIDLENEKGEIIDINFYTYALSRDIIKNIDNIDYEFIYNSITNHEHSDIYDSYVQKFILELISAYDEIQDMEIINTADKLLKYLNDSETMDEEIILINSMQIKKRINKKLSYNDKQTLIKLKESFNDYDTLKLCANILLENFDEAEFYYSKLTSKEKEDFDTLPICNLWKRDNK